MSNCCCQCDGKQYVLKCSDVAYIRTSRARSKSLIKEWLSKDFDSGVTDTFTATPHLHLAGTFEGCKQIKYAKQVAHVYGFQLLSCDEALKIEKNKPEPGDSDE